VRALLALALCIGHGPVWGAELRSFGPGDMGQIERAHRERAYVLALWSVACAHCPQELAVLGQFAREHPRLPVVLVSTDTPQDREAIAAALAGYGLGGTEHWVFADDYTEALRHAIDPRWGGELPRTYLVARDGSRIGLSGRVSPGHLRAWAEAQTTVPAP